MIDVTTIATLRPDILDRTLASIRRYVRSHHIFFLILDIAPVGENGFCQQDVYDVAKTHFGLIRCRMETVSPQAEAQKWVWSKAVTKFVLQWEDDWEALSVVDLDRDVLPKFDANPRLAMVFFDRHGKSVRDYPGYHGMFKQAGNRYFMRVKHKNFGGPPALIRQSFIRAALPLLKDDECLDVTCERQDAQEFLRQWDFGVLTAEDNNGLVRDIGKAWMKKNGFKKIKRGAKGFHWLKI